MYYVTTSKRKAKVDFLFGFKMKLKTVCSLTSESTYLYALDKFGLITRLFGLKPKIGLKFGVSNSVLEETEL